MGIQVEKTENFVLQGFTDSDFAGDLSTRRSHGGFMFKLGSTIIQCKSTQLKSVCLSSTESEFVFLSMAIQEAIYLLKICKNGFSLEVTTPVIFTDSQGAQGLATTPKISEASKHIATRYLDGQRQRRQEDCSSQVFEDGVYAC